MSVQPRPHARKGLSRAQMWRRARTVLALSGLCAAATLAAPSALAAAHPGSGGSQLIAAQFDALARKVGAGATPEARAAIMSQAKASLPDEVAAYHVKALWNSGTTGAGATVAVIESFGDPHIQRVIDEYDAKNDLPYAQVSILNPVGPVPTCTKKLAHTLHCKGWRGETDLDVAMVHTLAPGAAIIVTATPVAETEGFTGLPEMMLAIDYLTSHHLADVISMSLGTTEENFPSFPSIKTLDPALRRARAAGVPVVAASGDDGAASEKAHGGVFPFRAVGWPASDSLVTAVGGTELHFDGGHQTAPASLVNFSGAGFSKAYSRPAWQDGVSSITKSPMRALPDITMEGVEGTSQSAPLFAGILALATQQNSGPLGFVNPALYAMGPAGTKVGIVDVTKGDNSYAGVKGFKAGKGFDVASGWGTINATRFVPALVKQLDAP